MPGIQSEVQCASTLDLGRFQGPRRLSVYTYITRTRAHEFTHMLDIRNGNHRCAPGPTLTCSCTGPLVNSWSAPAASLAIVLPLCHPYLLPPPWNLGRSGRLVEPPANLSTSRSYSRVSYFTLLLVLFFFISFLSSARFSFASSWRIFMCLIELDVPRDTTFTIGDRLSFENNKIKRAVLHLREEAPVSKDGYVISSTEHMNTKSWMNN